MEGTLLQPESYEWLKRTLWEIKNSPPPNDMVISKYMLSEIKSKSGGCFHHWFVPLKGLMENQLLSGEFFSLAKLEGDHRGFALYGVFAPRVRGRGQRGRCGKIRHHFMIQKLETGIKITPMALKSSST